MSETNIDSTTSKKRNLKEITTNELLGRLRSKQDFYQYMDKHRKWDHFVD